MYTTPQQSRRPGRGLRWAAAVAAAAMVAGACQAEEPDGVDAVERTEQSSVRSDEGAPVGSSVAAEDAGEGTPVGSSVAAEDAGDELAAEPSDVASAEPGDDAGGDPTSTEPAADDPGDVEPVAESTMPDDVPEVAVAAAASRTIETSESQVAGMARMVTTASSTTPPDADTVAEWVASLRLLEQALDADAIRALGDDPLVEEIAGPIDALDQSVQRVIALLDPPSGSPDLLGALAEVQSGLAAWEAAVPGMEQAWQDAVERWSAAWDDAVAEWESAWAEAVAEWELAWADAVAEWELAWADAVAEWEQQWADAVADWEQQWADAAAEWEQQWAEAAAEWEQQWADAIAEWEASWGTSDDADPAVTD